MDLLDNASRRAGRPAIHSHTEHVRVSGLPKVAGSPPSRLAGVAPQTTVCVGLRDQPCKADPSSRRVQPLICCSISCINKHNTPAGAEMQKQCGQHSTCKNTLKRSLLGSTAPRALKKHLEDSTPLFPTWCSAGMGFKPASGASALPHGQFRRWGRLDRLFASEISLVSRSWLRGNRFAVLFPLPVFVDRTRFEVVRYT
jgi:hypothetical protein